MPGTSSQTAERRDSGRSGLSYVDCFEPNLPVKSCMPVTNARSFFPVQIAAGKIESTTQAFPRGTRSIPKAMGPWREPARG